MKKLLTRILLVLAALYLVLLIPDCNNNPPVIKISRAFEWNNDNLWLNLEQKFREAKKMRTAELDSLITTLQKEAEFNLATVHGNLQPPYDSLCFEIEDKFFQLAPLIAVNGDCLSWYTDFYNRTRNEIKQSSLALDLNDRSVRNTIYSPLYGMRAAYEEVLLQIPGNRFPPAIFVKEEQSSTPSAMIFGITVHSGDILVSRGGAEVSAFISRANDYPGNFSHIALLYVDENTRVPYLIEAHIEKGVAISTVDTYEKDKKLRFMVMRMRRSTGVMQTDSMLPHKAARLAYQLAKQRHIPYDFKMNYNDSSAMFCSEVASYAYRKNGVQLWNAISTISSQGKVNWLHDFGVENFRTQMPSDLEYDKQLSVVAEWRDPGTLRKDHIDNAVMDALLEKADEGKKIRYNLFMLPVVRMIKAWSFIRNRFGYEATIPEGMSATQALKNQTLVKMHRQIKAAVLKMAADFTRQYQYNPPYWQLLRFAREATKGF